MRYYYARADRLEFFCDDTFSLIHGTLSIKVVATMTITTRQQTCFTLVNYYYRYYYYSVFGRFRNNEITENRHAFVHQKIGFPVQNVRPHHPHAGLSDVGDGTLLDRSDQQGDGQRRALRRHQVPASGGAGRIFGVQLHATRTLRRVPRPEIVSITLPRHDIICTTVSAI